MSVSLLSSGRLPTDKVTRYPVAWLLAITLLLFMKPLSAQELSYKKYGVKEALPGLVIYHSLQDKHGYIWFATNRGVSRFDGKFFKTYSKEDGLPDNEILKLYLDKNDNIWFISFPGIASVLYKDTIRQINCKGVFYVMEDPVDGLIYLLGKQIINGKISMGYYRSLNNPGKWQF